MTREQAKMIRDRYRCERVNATMALDILAILNITDPNLIGQIADGTPVPVWFLHLLEEAENTK